MRTHGSVLKVVIHNPTKVWFSLGFECLDIFQKTCLRRMGRQCCGRGSREEPPPAQPKVQKVLLHSLINVFGLNIHTLYVQERQYIPAEDMGDYEEYKKKKSPKKSGPLYPLNEEVNSDFKKSIPQLQFPNISKNLDLLQPRAHMAPHQPHCPSPCPDTRRGRGSPRCTPAMPSPATATCTPTS